jgi:hypothetical protein
MLGHLEDLRYLTLSNGGMPDLASVLSLSNPTTHEDEVNQGGRTPNNQARDRILIPRLEGLELDQISFSLPGSQSDTAGFVISQRRLFEALSTRNSPSGRLIMTRCDRSRFGAELVDMVRSWDDLEVSQSDSGYSLG